MHSYFTPVEGEFCGKLTSHSHSGGILCGKLIFHSPTFHLHSGKILWLAHISLTSVKNPVVSAFNKIPQAISHFSHILRDL
jgi:hypothetical protein